MHYSFSFLAAFLFLFPSLLLLVHEYDQCFIMFTFNMTDTMTPAHTQLTVHSCLGEGPITFCISPVDLDEKLTRNAPFFSQEFAGRDSNLVKDPSLQRPEFNRP